MSDTPDIIGRGFTFPFRVDKTDDRTHDRRRRHRIGNARILHCPRRAPCARVRPQDLGSLVRADRRQHARPDGGVREACVVAVWASRCCRWCDRDALRLDRGCRHRHRVHGSSHERSTKSGVPVLRDPWGDESHSSTPNLDDRNAQSLVDEVQLILTYCPEWTNHNVSDPGVALIELFADERIHAAAQSRPTPTRECWICSVKMFSGQRSATISPLASRRCDGLDSRRTGRNRQRGRRSNRFSRRPSRSMRLRHNSLPCRQQASVANSCHLMRISGEDPYRSSRRWLLALPSISALTAHWPGRFLTSGLALRTRSVSTRLGRPFGGRSTRPNPGSTRTWLLTRLVANRDGIVGAAVPMVEQSAALSAEPRFGCERCSLNLKEISRPIGPYLRSTQSPPRESPWARRLSTAWQRARSASARAMGDLISGSPRSGSFSSCVPTTVEVVTAAGWHSSGASRRLSRVRPEWSALSLGSDNRRGAVRSTNPRLAKGTITGMGLFLSRELRFGWRYRHGGGDLGNVPAGCSPNYVPRSLRWSCWKSGPASGGTGSWECRERKTRGPMTIRAAGRAVTAEDYERLVRQADSSIARVRPEPEPLGAPVRLLLVPESARNNGRQPLSMPLLFRWDRGAGRRLSGRASRLARRLNSTPFYQGQCRGARPRRPARPPDVVRDRALPLVPSSIRRRAAPTAPVGMHRRPQCRHTQSTCCWHWWRRASGRPVVSLGCPERATGRWGPWRSFGAKNSLFLSGVHRGSGDESRPRMAAPAVAAAGWTTTFPTVHGHFPGNGRYVPWSHRCHWARLDLRSRRFRWWGRWVAGSVSTISTRRSPGSSAKGRSSTAPSWVRAEQPRASGFAEALTGAPVEIRDRGGVRIDRPVEAPSHVDISAVHQQVRTPCSWMMLIWPVSFVVFRFGDFHHAAGRRTIHPVLELDDEWHCTDPCPSCGRPYDIPNFTDVPRSSVPTRSATTPCFGHRTHCSSAGKQRSRRYDGNREQPASGRKQVTSALTAANSTMRMPCHVGAVVDLRIAPPPPPPEQMPPPPPHELPPPLPDPSRWPPAHGDRSDRILVLLGQHWTRWDVARARCLLVGCCCYNRTVATCPTPLTARTRTGTRSPQWVRWRTLKLSMQDRRRRDSVPALGGQLVLNFVSVNGWSVVGEPPMTGQILNALLGPSACSSTERPTPTGVAVTTEL